MKIKKKVSNLFYDMERDGVTQSLISTWLTCRMKARLYLQGWDSRYHSPALTYGSIGHGALEVAYLDIQAGKLKSAPSESQSRKYMDIVEAKWRAENKKPNNEALQYLELSLALMEKTLPRYFDYWKKDFKQMEWVSLEKKFKAPLSLNGSDPANRRLIGPHGVEPEIIIPIRGKRDGEFKMGKGLWLFETKFKSMVNEGDIVETLAFETQVMLYMWSLWMEYKKRVVPKGVMYNIVRRTSMRQGKSESIVKFANRVAEDIDKRPEFYFFRMESATTVQELEQFEKELIQTVTDMYMWWKGIAPHYRNTYSCLGKYGKCTMLPVCAREDYSGLIKREAMFKELEDF